MFIEDITKRIEELSGEIGRQMGVDLIKVKVGGRTNDFQVQVTADKRPCGITVGECAILNKALVAAIGQEGLLAPGTFSLEVSSPGIE